MRTNLSAIPSISPIVAELMIGHRQQGSRPVYDQRRYGTEQSAGFEAWSCAVALDRRAEPRQRCGVAGARMSKHDKQAQAEPVDEGPTIIFSADDMALLDADDRWGSPDPTILGEWLRDALDCYIPIPPPRWTAVAARVEHIGKLARQLVDTAAELETLLTGTYTSTSILMSQEEMDGIAVGITVGEQGLNVRDLAKHLKQQLRQPTEYLASCWKRGI